MQASTPELAAAAIELGVNGIVAQGSEAGGHARGHIPLHALLATIRHKWPDMLLLGAGGISDGTAAAAAFRAGADGVWVGTSLVAAEEANAHPEYKRRLIDSPGKTLRTKPSDPNGPTSPTGFSPPVQCKAQRHTSAVPNHNSTTPSVEHDCFHTR